MKSKHRYGSDEYWMEVADSHIKLMKWYYTYPENFTFAWSCLSNGNYALSGGRIHTWVGVGSDSMQKCFIEDYRFGMRLRHSSRLWNEFPLEEYKDACTYAKAFSKCGYELHNPLTLCMMCKSISMDNDVDICNACFPRFSKDARSLIYQVNKTVVAIRKLTKETARNGNEEHEAITSGNGRNVSSCKDRKDHRRTGKRNVQRSGKDSNVAAH